MADKKTASPARTPKDNARRIATVAAGAAIGSAAIAAAVLFASKHRGDSKSTKTGSPSLPPSIPTPESD